MLISDYNSFADCYTLLKIASRDKHAGRDTEVFMTNSQLTCVNFDMVKDKYAAAIGPVQTPMSCDALMQDKAGHLYLIEFKNGKMSKDEVFKVRRKILDSLLIATDIMQRGVSFTRDNMDFILVYNDVKNSNDNDTTDIINSPSLNSFANIMFAKANDEIVRFDLLQFKKLYFKNIHTYTQPEFDTKFIKSFIA